MHRCLKHWHLITQQQREGSLFIHSSTHLNILKTNDSLNQNDLFYDQKLRKQLEGSAGNPHNSLWPTSMQLRRRRREKERGILEACKTQTRSLDVEKWAWLEIVFGLRRRQRCWQTFPCGSGACELKTHWAQSIITRPRYISAAEVAVAVTAAAVACHWARSAFRQESSAATIFFNFPQQSSVDNKLMRVALAKVLLFSLLLLHLNYARPQRKCHSSSFMLAEWYITHTSCAPLCRNSLLDESNGGDGEKSSKGCKFFLHVYTINTIAVFMCSQIRNAGALTVEMSVQHNLHCHGSKYIALCNAI